MQVSRCRFLDAGFWMQDSGFRMQDSGCRMQDSRFKMGPPLGGMVMLGACSKDPLADCCRLGDRHRAEPSADVEAERFAKRMADADRTNSIRNSAGAELRRVTTLPVSGSTL